jgi:hypothetical protein
MRTSWCVVCLVAVSLLAARARGQVCGPGEANVVPNCDFDTDNSGWTVIGTASHAWDMGEGSAAPGCDEVTTCDGSVFVRQCFDDGTLAGQPVTYGADFREASGDVVLTLGSKVEHNDYTGFEAQPSARLAFYKDDRQTLWAAASRAVRTPSRLDADLLLRAPIEVPGAPLPVLAVFTGDDDFTGR